MDHIQPVSNNQCSELNDRTLWFDGDSTIPADKILDFINEIDGGIFVDEITSEIKQYNSLFEQCDQIKVKTKFNEIVNDWNIPEEYNILDITQYVRECLINDCENKNFSNNDIEKRIKRIDYELKLFDMFDNMSELIRTLIYIINTLIAHNIVWGIGRGSSVSSYVLYLIGIHDVDSVEYDLDIHDFLRLT